MSGQSRRAWGWHPLTADWAERVVATSPVRPGDLVLDLGAGTGALTAPLVAAGARVLAVELHPRRAGSLRDRFADADVTVIEADLCDLRLPRRPFRVVASPPYSIGSDLVRLLLSDDRLLSADLVLQRAAVRRLVQTPPRARHSRRFQLSIGMTVPRRAFHPAPKVDSAVLRLRR